MTVYGDIYALINALCDMIVLSVTAMVIRRPIKVGRQLAAAGMGGLFALFSLYIPDKPFLLFPFSVLCSFGMVFIAFSFTNIKGSLVPFFSFYIISALMGGMAEFALSLFRLALDQLTALLLLLGTLLFSAVLTVWAGRAFLKRSITKIAELSFLLNGKRYTVTAFCDSGNLAVDPESGLPVIFLTKNFFKEVPLNERTFAVSTVAGEAEFPLFTPEDVYINKEERVALLALTEYCDFDGLSAMIPNILLI